MNVLKWNGLRGRARLLPSLGRSEVAHPQRLGGSLALPALVLVVAVFMTGCAKDRSADLRDSAVLTSDMRLGAIANLDTIDAIAKRHVPHRPADWKERVERARSQFASFRTLGAAREALRELVESVGDPHFRYVGQAPSFMPDRSVAGLTIVESPASPYGAVVIRAGDLDRMAGQLEELARTMRQGNASLILDLRGSDGGQLTVAAGIVGFFVDADTRLGEIVDGETRIDLIARARPPEQRYRGKIAVLVDRHTISAAEVLATSLQRFAGARVFGEPTAGAASPSTVIQLANGDWLQHPVGRFEPSDVAPVRPDEIVTGEEAAKRAMEWARGN